MALGRFRNKLTLILDKDYNEIVLNESQQINKIIKQIKNNEDKCTTDYDFELFGILRELCEKFGSIEELSQVNRLFSVYYYNTNKILSAIESMKTAIDLIKDKRKENLLINYYIELARLYGQNDETEKAKNVNDIIEEKILNKNDLEDDILFEYYYQFGIINNRRDSNFARSLFEKALYYSKDKGKVGAV